MLRNIRGLPDSSNLISNSGAEFDFCLSLAITKRPTFRKRGLCTHYMVQRFHCLSEQVCFRVRRWGDLEDIRMLLKHQTADIMESWTTPKVVSKGANSAPSHLLDKGERSGRKIWVTWNGYYRSLALRVRDFILFNVSLQTSLMTFSSSPLSCLLCFGIWSEHQQDIMYIWTMDYL